MSITCLRVEFAESRDSLDPPNAQMTAKGKGAELEDGLQQLSAIQADVEEAHIVGVRR